MVSSVLIDQIQWAKATMLGKKFLNIKNESIYYVTNITIDTETLELRVIYSDGISINEWDRPLTMFVDKFKECN